MKKIRILITGAGAPGIAGTVYSLRNNFDNRLVYIIGTDIKEDVVGKYICDYFYQIPPASKSVEYIAKLQKICKDEDIEILIPQNTMELSLLANYKNEFEQIGVKIIISNRNSIDNANNKLKLMHICKKNGVSVGEFYLVNDFLSLKKYAEILGWPNKRVVVKPPISNGLRGVRIIDEKYNPKEAFYSEKPNSLIISLEMLKSILGDEFPNLIITEYLPGEEITVDLFRDKSSIIVIPRLRETIRSGITFNGKVVKNETIINYSRILANNLNLEFCFGFQFKFDNKGEPKILESNPRVQGTMVLSTFANANVIWMSVKYALGEEVIIPEIAWDTRLLRYWGGVAELNGKKIGLL